MSETATNSASELAAHDRSAETVLAALNSAGDGLSADEARARRAAHGPNALPEARSRHPLVRFLAQFNNPLIYFLLLSAVAAWLLGHHVDASVILAVVLVNAVVGYVQEGKAEQALAAIRKMVVPRASALRDGRRVSIAVEDLTLGDVVLLEPGDRVPADLRLLKAKGLLVDEALLTGESVVAEKDTIPVPAMAPLGDRHCMAYSGTLVVAGQAAGVVVAIGTATEIGRISTMLEAVEQLTTPLLRQMNRFSRRFAWTAFAGAAALFAFAVLFRGYDWPDALIAVVALSVGVIPEGLPAVITITLAIGVQRMAARKAIVRRLPAVETLGATSVICSDKTGTLTRNEMTAQRVVGQRDEVSASGSGYAPEGRLTAERGEDDAASIAAIMPVIRCGLLCNDAHLRRQDGRWAIEGDPMEAALVALAMKAGLDPDHERAEWRRLDEIPFDAAHRFMACLYESRAGERIVFLKGAPERLLEMAVSEAGPTGERPLDPAWWAERIASAASAGERVLGFALRHVGPDHARLTQADLGSGVSFLGIVGFIDPPRDEAIAAIAECRAAGIEVKMITGDHAATAGAIARQLAMADDPRVTTGAELDRMPGAALPELARHTTVFARASPEHKLHIVRALQSQGAVVAMTGDGVNDAPSLKQADIGIAMGLKGTEAAKEASQMILLDDNFATIVNAVHEGRTVYDNIRKVVAWTLPTNGGEVLTVIAAIIGGFLLPMTAAQILWINLILTVTLGLVLAFEPSEPGVMGRPPRDAQAPLLSPFLLWRVGLVSCLFAVAALAVFFGALGAGRDLATARTMVVNTIVVLEIFYLFNVRYMNMTSITLRGVVGTPAVLVAVAAVVVAQFAFTYLPFMHELFDSRPLGLADGFLIVAIGVGLMFLLEGEMLLLRRLGIFDELKLGTLPVLSLA
ncbi:MAG: HAD-IC family P-type ATPase [Geminicoccaceae bacterium]